MSLDALTHTVRFTSEAAYPRDAILVSLLQSILVGLKAAGVLDFTVSSSEPGTPSANQIWLKPDSGLAEGGAPEGDATFKRWNGASFQTLTPSLMAAYLLALGTLDGLPDGASYVRMTTAERVKLAALSGNIVGAYADLTALATAHPTGAAGSLAILTHGSGQTPTFAVWDSDEGSPVWIDIGALSLPSASTTVAGIVQLATSAEAVTGTGTSKALTPVAGRAAADQHPATLLFWAANFH